MIVIKRLVLVAVFVTPWMTNAQDISLRAIKKQVAKASLYELQFTPAAAFLAEGAVRVRFPEAYDLTGIQIAGSNQINGGLKVSVDSAGVIITRTGLGDSSPAGKRVSIIFGPIVKTKPGAADSAEVVLFFQGLKKRSNRQAFKIPIR